MSLNYSKYLIHTKLSVKIFMLMQLIPYIWNVHIEVLQEKVMKYLENSHDVCNLLSNDLERMKSVNSGSLSYNHSDI